MKKTLVAIAIMGMGIGAASAADMVVKLGSVARSPGRSRTSARTMKTAPVWLWKTQTPRAS